MNYLNGSLEKKQTEIHKLKSEIESLNAEKLILTTETDKLTSKLQSAREKLIQVESDTSEKINKLENQLRSIHLDKEVARRSKWS